MNEYFFALIASTAIILSIWLRKQKYRKICSFLIDSGFIDVEWNGESFLGRYDDLSFEITPNFHREDSNVTLITAPISYEGPSVSFSPFFFKDYPDWSEISLDLGRGEPLKQEETEKLKTIFEQPFRMFEIENGQVKNLFPRIELNIEEGQFYVIYSGFPKKNIVALIKLLKVLKINLDKVKATVQQLA
jgi:hypothetical protein